MAILTCLKHAVPVPDARDLTYISAQIFSRLICYAQSRKRTFRRPDLIGFSPAVATGSLKHVTAGLKHGRNANRVASSTPWPRSLRTPTSRFCPYHTSVIAYTDSEMREISTCLLCAHADCMTIVLSRKILCAWKMSLVMPVFSLVLQGYFPKIGV